MTDDDRSGWRAWRREGITATDVAKVVTGRYGGAYGVLAEKRGIEFDISEEQRDRMDRGKDLEPVIAGMVELGTGLHVVGEETWCEHAEHPEHRCTVDGFLAADLAHGPDEAVATLEEKSHDVDVHPAWNYYRAQVRWQLYVTGFDLAVLAVSAYDSIEDICHGPRIELIRPSQLELLPLLNAALLIEQHLADGTWPDPDGSKVAAEVLAHLHPAPVAVEILDLSHLSGALAEYVELKELTKKNGRVDELGQLIRAAIGDHGEGHDGELLAKWGAPSRQLDRAALLEDHPEFAVTLTDVDVDAATEALGKKAIDEYRRPTGSRSLTVKPLKKENA